jgi:thiamine-monophosphate kinase
LLPSVATLTESALLERLRARVGAPPSFVAIGIGDDAAAIEPLRGTLDVITTDSLIEHVHFRRDWTAARAIGGKAVAVNLSDLAAMGAVPRAILLSLALPPDLAVDDFDELIEGVVAAATSAGAALIGGNLARSSGPLVVDVTAIGAAGRRRLLTRRGGRAGDELYLTGAIGAAGAGLAWLQSGADRASVDPVARECIHRFEHPEARTRCGRIIAGHRAASACIDLSDGLADAARQLAEAAGTGVVLDAAALPIHEGALNWAERERLDAASFAVSSGEDYELLFAVRPRRRRAFLGAMQRCAGLPVTRVGQLTAEPGAWLDRGGNRETLGPGFTHFAA